MPLVRYEGILLKRGDALATSLACCCEPDCNCCSFENLTSVASTFVYRNSFGVTNGNIVAGSDKKVRNTGCASQTAPIAEKCVGKLEFEVLFTNGGCSESEVVAGSACLFVKRSKDNDNKGNCCFWEVFVEEPDYSECLKEGFPTGQIATVPGCQGADAPSDCIFIIPADPCFGLCDQGGWDTISFTTNAPGNCTCLGDEEYI
jgi:hypothetical protein